MSDCGWLVVWICAGKQVSGNNVAGVLLGLGGGLYYAWLKMGANKPAVVSVAPSNTPPPSDDPRERAPLLAK